MTNRTDSNGARNVARHALLQGGRRIPHRPVVEWDVSGSCSHPRLVTTEGKPWRDFYPSNGPESPGWAPDRYERATLRLKVEQRPFWVDMLVRCRKCTACLKARAHHWAERAAYEVMQAPRTWFGTLTFSPAEQWRSEARARIALADAGGWGSPVARRWNDTDGEFANRVEAARFSRMHHANGPLLTKWLKRIRKESGASLRYLLVAEAHKSGRPHYHVLIHESHGGGTVLHRTLSNQWIHGFSQFKLADRDAARYVCKYLAKSAAARIRASGSYGRLYMPSDSGVAHNRGRSPRL